VGYDWWEGESMDIHVKIENGAVFRSIDGITWGEITLPYGFSPQRVLVMPDRFFIVIGNNGERIVTSYDSIIWKEIPYGL
jgi:hypothetical protein